MNPTVEKKDRFSHHWKEFDITHPREQDFYNLDDFVFPDGVSSRVYTNDARTFHYPSVTSVIGYINNITGANDWLDAWRARVGAAEADRIVNQALTYGNYMHDRAEQYLLNEQVINNNPYAHTIFMELKKALDRINGIIFCEHALVSHLLGIAGRIDCFALDYYGMPYTVVDFKTSRRNKTVDDITGYFIQVTLYSMMIHEMIGIQPEIGTIAMVVWGVDGVPPYLKEFDVIFGNYRETAIDLIAKYHTSRGNHDFDIIKAKEFFL